MSQLSALIGKPVLNITTSCIIGKVTDVYFDEYLKTAVYFGIEREGEKTNFLFEYAEAQSILDAIVIADDIKFISPLDVDLTALRSDIVGMPVYTPSGADKGTLADVIITASGKVTKLQTESNEFTPAGILSIGNVIVQKNSVKIKARKVTIPRPKEDYPVYILGDAKKALEIEKSILDGSMPIPMIQNEKESAPRISKETAFVSDIQKVPAPKVSVENTSETQSQSAPKSPIKTDIASAMRNEQAPIAHILIEKEPVLSNGAFEMLLDGSNAYSYDEDARTPTRVICDYDFLLGRTLGADLCTYTGELIARQNSIVSDKIVQKARRAGKLVELTLNSVKPEKSN